MRLRQLTTLEEFRTVCALEHEVWGYTSSEDAVPVPMLIVSVKIGGLLIGAFDEADRMVGFVYSLPGVSSGRPFQWSHMLGVAADHRDRGVAWQLKMEQRRLSLARGLNLVKWTFDPLQALNAHLNFAKLGIVSNEYEEDVYGESSSVLHRGTPTDRLIAEWWLRAPRVEDRLAEVGRGSAPPAWDPAGLGVVNEVAPAGEWLAPARQDLSRSDDQLGVVIPMGFTEMQQREPGLARDWRASTREIFETYLSRGYQVVEFVLERAARRGVYALARNAER